jgi:hypothetical protein
MKIGVLKICSVSLYADGTSWLLETGNCTALSSTSTKFCGTDMGSQASQKLPRVSQGLLSFIGYRHLKQQALYRTFPKAT